MLEIRELEKRVLCERTYEKEFQKKNVYYRIEPISEDMQWWGKYVDSKEGWERGRTNQCIKLYGNCASMTTRLSELSMRFSNGNIERESDPLLLISQVPWLNFTQKTNHLFIILSMVQLDVSLCFFTNMRLMKASGRSASERKLLLEFLH